VNYPDSVQFLYALGNEIKTAKLGLERIRATLAALGDPQNRLRFIHVAGTNGKGSTCAMIAGILTRAGLRAGLYTSPHLIEPTERIQIQGEPVTPEEFARAFEIVHAAAEKLEKHPSYFETVTAMALLIFRERCDISVMEVGLGGRLDATNVIAPEVCVITPIAYDHEAFLGNTIEAIAAEKAGIIKQKVPLVVARQLPQADAVIADRARQLECRIIRTAGACLRNARLTACGSSFELNGLCFECPLAGKHQLENAAAAILACSELGIPPDAIQAGLKNVRWPGRLEFLSHAPDFVLDGAHNPAAAAALAEYIRAFPARRPVWLVYGAMRDKAIEEIAAQLFPLADRLILTAPNYARALRPEAILQIANHPNATLTRTVAEAIEVARTASQDAMVFFTGSLFVVGEARGLLLGRDPFVS
jgi:dihydrofolate synthase/folylpolyglutamate synthase